MTDPAPAITFVSHTSQPGGGELALRRYLQATERPVRLVTLEAGGVWDGVATEVVHAAGLPGLRAAVAQGGLVVANSMRAALLTSLVAPRDTRLAYWVRDGLTESAMSPFALALTKYVTARRVQHYLANSEWTAGTIGDYLGIPSGRITVVTSMCGVRSEGIVRRVGASRPIRLLYLGRIAAWKAPDVAVKALVPLGGMGVDARLSIVGAPIFGEKGYAESLRALVSLEPRAQLVGYARDVRPVLRTHDVLVHTSRCPEPFGQVVVQALAAGIPAVVTRGGGPEEVIAGAPVDLTYRGGDADQLAAAVLRVLSNYQDVSDWASQRALAYADEVIAARTDAAFAPL